MRNWKKLTLAGAVASVALFTAGCVSRYDDDYYRDGYDGRYYHTDRDHRWHSGDNWRDRHDRDRSDNDRRVRVCDTDGSNCHFEYRDR